MINAKSFNEILQVHVDDATFIFFGKTQNKNHADSSCRQWAKKRPIIIYGVPQSGSWPWLTRYKLAWVKLWLCPCFGRMHHALQSLSCRSSRFKFTWQATPTWNNTQQRRRKTTSPQPKKDAALGNARLFFHQSCSRAKRLKYRALKEELQFRKDQE